MLRKSIQNPRKLIWIGMWFLILASVSNTYLHRMHSISEDWADGITGLLYGLTIGTLLLGVWLKGRRGSCA